MKEAPEKIYIQPNAHDGWFDIIPNSDMLVEYVRKDAFIEKACEWLKTNYTDFLDSSRLGINIEELVKDLKNDFKKE